MGRSFLGVLVMDRTGKAGVEVRPATSIADFLFARRLRNAVRLNMTGNTAPIGLWQQLLFWWRRPPGLEIYMAEVDGERAGYLLLRPRGDTWLITEAVSGSFRRRGVAAAMIRFAQDRYPDITAEILAGNAASIALHRACGFQSSQEQTGTLVVYRFRRSLPDMP